MPEPPKSDGSVLVDGLLVGLCGTDSELVAADSARLPSGEDQLILGHESLGRVADAPEHSGLRPGDLVTGIVRRPDPDPCPACARGAWDFCRNGRYTERGIKGQHGFGSRRWRIEPAYAVKVPDELGDLGVLVEPTSVVAKAWEQVEAVTTNRTGLSPRTALVTGAGPIGLLAALLGVRRGLDVWVLDRVTGGAKPALVRDLGAHYVTDVADAGKPDVVMECTGADALILAGARALGPGGALCLTGVSHAGAETSLRVGEFAGSFVSGNRCVLGTVNAARRHYAQAVEELRAADADWLAGLLSRRVPLTEWIGGLDKSPEEVKVVVDLQH